MKPETLSLLIGIVTLSQILVLSFIAPIRLRRFSTMQYDNHPETEYPRWYPVPRAELDRLVNRHVVVSMAAGLVGLIWLICAMVIGAAPMSLAAFTMCFLLLQLWSGELAWLRGARKVLRALREMPPPARRSVELHRWRISDFVSPVVIVLGFASQLAAVAVGMYAYLQGRHAALPASGFIVVALLAASLWILGRLVYRILRPVSPARIDPSMADADLYRLRQRVVQGQFVQAATVGLLNAFALAIFGGIIAIDPLWFFLAFSLWAQARWLLSPGSLFRFVRSQDFSVYRAA